MAKSKIPAEALKLADDIERRTSELATKLLAELKLDEASKLMTRGNYLVAHPRRTYEAS